MTLAVVKAKRKVSCLLCRLKKVKCDGGQPCDRCVKKDCGEQCAYDKQRPLGRPPKNAVVNKLILSRTKQQLSTNNLCMDFIIENLSFTIPSGTKFLHNDKTKNLDYFMENYFTDTFSTAITQLGIVRVDGPLHITTLDIKIYDLLEAHCWTTEELTNIFISKTSDLPLNTALEYNSIASAMFQELIYNYFKIAPIVNATNPLTTLPTPQAVRWIECFFCVHPYSILLNKTLLLQAFWTDTIDPLLLCVIYGTTSYFAKMLEGRPVGLWEAATEDRRNPYLEYAYFLLQKSSSEATLVKYQAIILLGMFESRHGLPKRGMILNGLAYMMGAKLGVMDGSLLSTEISDVESELLSCAYWTHFNNTIRGCIDVGHAAHFTKDFDDPPPLPPVSIETSLSYQLEKSCNDQRLFRSYSYLVESFYVSCVISKYINKLLLCFPEVKFNVTCSGYNIKTRRKVGCPKVKDLVTGLTGVLLEFGVFIQESQHVWSPQQRSTINLVWMLLDVHLIFIMDHRPTQGVNYSNSIFDIFTPTRLSIGDTKSMDRIALATPKIFAMIDTITTLSEPTHQPPRALTVSALETAITVLCLKHQADQENNVWDYLTRISEFTKNNMWMGWTAIQSVRNRIDDYMKTRFIPSPRSFTTEDDLALAALLDPCSNWLTPLANGNLSLDTIFWNDPSLAFINNPVGSSAMFYPDDMTSLSLTPPVKQHNHLSTPSSTTTDHDTLQDILTATDPSMYL